MATITGTAGDDTLNGTKSADTIIAGSGNDVINAGAGNDTIIGGAGADTLTGGNGQDTFVYQAAADSTMLAWDTITDFTVGKDLIDLTALGGLNWSGTTQKIYSVWYEQSGGNTYVYADTTGDGGADFKLQLNGAIALTAASFVGLNQAPDLRKAGGDVIVASLTEVSAPLTTSGTLTVTDADAPQAVTVSVLATAVSGDPAAVAAVQGAAASWLTIPAGSLAANPGEVNNLAWTFDSGSQNFDFLKKGETLTITYTVEARDSNALAAGTDTQTITITIKGSNDVPTVFARVGDVAGLDLQEGDAGFVSGGTLGYLDADSLDTITASVASVAATGPTGTLNNAQLRGFMSAVAQPDLNPGAQTSGSLAWTFNSGAESFQFLGDGETLTLDYTLRVSDATNATATYVVSVVIHGENDAPVLSGSTSLAYTENGAGLSVNNALTLVDVDDSAFAFATVSVTENYQAGQDELAFTNSDAIVYGDISGVFNAGTGVLTLQSTGGLATSAQWQSALRAVTYSNTSDNPSAAIRTFEFQISDGSAEDALSNVVTSTIEVSPVNDAPVAISSAASTDEDVVLNGSVSATDPESDVLIYGLFADASNGAVVVNADGTYAYTPNTDFNGSDSFTFSVSDGNGGSATGVVNLTVNPVNDAPVAADTAASTDEDTVLDGVLPVAADVEGNEFVYSLAANAAHGSVVVNPDGTYTYTPDADFNGSDSFTYVVTDLINGQPGASSSPYTVSITVNPSNDAPYLNLDGATEAPDPDVGVIDTNDGGGIAITRLSVGNDQAFGVVTQPDGKLVVVGYTTSPSGIGQDFAVVRYLASGHLDTSFGTNGKVILPVSPGAGSDVTRAVALQDDGRIVVAGYATGTASGLDVALARLNVDGSLDASFGNGGIATLALGGDGRSDAALGVAIQSDGKIVTVGWTTNGSGSPPPNDMLISRFNADGTVDGTFGTAGSTITSVPGYIQDVAQDVAVDSLGRIVVTGWSYINSGNGADIVVARYTPTGVLDPSFSADGLATVSLSVQNGNNLFENGRSVAVVEGDKILVGGWTQVIGKGLEFVLLKFNADGSPDTAFGSPADANFPAGPKLGYVTTSIAPNNGFDQGYDLLVLSDGKILLAGAADANSSAVSTVPDFALVRYNADGSRDTTFGGGDGIATVAVAPGTLPDGGYSLAQQPDGSIVVAGYTGANGNQDFALVRFHPDGTLDQSFNSTVVVSAGADFGVSVPADFIVDPDGDALVYAITLADGSALPEWMHFDSGTLRLTGNPPVGAEDLFLRVSATDGEYSASHVFLLNINNAPVLLGDGDSDPNSPAATGILDFHSGRVTTAIGTGADNGYGVLVQPDGKVLVVGGASTPSGGLDVALVRYDIYGRLDATFGSGGKVLLPVAPGTGTDYAWNIALQADGKVVLTGSTATNGVDADALLMRFEPNGALDGSFGTGGKVVLALAGGDSAFMPTVLPGGKILVAGFVTGDTTGQDFALWRFNADGSPDDTFGGGDGYVTAPVDAGAGNDFALASAIDSVGNIVLAGVSNTAGAPNIALARFTADGAMDTSFGVGGVATASFTNAVINGFAEQGRSVALQGDGSILVSGWTVTATGLDFALVRFTAAGVLDTTFGGGDGLVTTAVAPGNGLDWAFDMVVQPDGKVLLAGAADMGTPGTGRDVALVRYNPDGSLDTSFGESHTGIVTAAVGPGAGAHDGGFSIALLPDGRIVVAGSATMPAGEDIALLRFMPDGEPDNTFNPIIVVQEGGAFSFAFPPNWIVDPDGDALAYSVTQADGSALPAGWTFNALTRQIAGTPASGSADVVLRITGTDIYGASNSQILTLKVESAPTAVAGAISTDEDTVLNGSVAAVDADGDALTFSLATGTTHGSVVVNANGSYTYTPDADYNGSDSFSFTVTDQYGLSNTATVNITVNPVNDAPYYQDADADSPIPSIGIIDGDGGAVTTAIGPLQSADAATYAVLQSDGKILVVGSATMAGGDPGMAIVRYNRDGTLDSTFGTGGKQVLHLSTGTGAESANSVAVLADGRILVAGFATNPTTDINNVPVATGQDVVLVRLNSNGSYDTTFGGGDGIVITQASAGTGDDAAFNVLVRSDGRIVLAGNATTGSGWDFMLAGYNADGSIDSNFGGGTGIVTTTIGSLNDRAFRAVLDGDGKIVVTGFTTVGANNNSGATDIVLARYNADGSPDGTFGGGDGIVITSLNGATSGAFEHGRQVAVLEDGKILVGGLTVGTSGTGGDFLLLRYLPNGDLDPSFGASGGYTRLTLSPGNANDFAFDMKVLPGGQILLAGQAGVNGNDFALVRFDSTGLVDTTFGDDNNGIVIESVGQGSANDIAFRMLVQPDGQILLVGTVNTPMGGADIGLMRFSADGSKDGAFGTTLVINDGAPFQVAIPPGIFVDPDGDVLVYSATQADGSALPDWLTFDPGTQLFSGTPSAASDVSIRLTATDTGGLSTTLPITFHVNHAPPSTTSTLNMTENGVGQTPQPVDGDRDVLTFALESGPQHGSVVFVSTSGAVVTYSPNPNYFGSDTFTYTATDWYGLSSTQTVNVNVAPTTSFSDLKFESTYQLTANANTQLPQSGQAIGAMHATGSLGDQASVTWSLTGSGTSVLAIDPNTGVITATANFGVTALYTVSITATGTGALAGSNRTETFDFITGSTGNDVVPLNGPANTVLAGDDVLFGFTGNDNTIWGGPANDTLLGQDGNDVLRGGSGHDWMWGGAGSDTFVIVETGVDVIADFQPGVDKLDLSGLTNPDWTSFNDVTSHSTVVNGGLLIDLDGVNSIFLVGITNANPLNQGDVLL